MLKGFHTASGKEVKTSQEALERARKLWESIQADSPQVDSPQGSSSALKKKVSSFKSPVQFKVSEESLEKAEKLWESTKEDVAFQKANQERLCKRQGSDAKEVKFPEFRQGIVHQMKPSNHDDASTGLPLHGFQTASGKPTQISLNSLKAGQKLWESTQVGEVSARDGKGKVPVRRGFQTPSRIIRNSESVPGKSVGEKMLNTDCDLRDGSKSVPACRPQIASGMVEPLENENKVILESSAGSSMQQSVFKGFQTASGKTVTVSAKAMERSRKLWESLQADIEPPLGADEPEISIPSGSQAAETTSKVGLSESCNKLGPKVFSGVLTPNRGVNNVSDGSPQIGKKKWESLQVDVPVEKDGEGGSPSKKKIKLSSEDTDGDKESTIGDDDARSIEQEILESTFALLADEEENEGSRNAVFGEAKPIPLQKITQNGGKIPLLHVCVVRVYPITYMSRNEHGRNIYESDKTFRKHQRQREQARQLRNEKLYAEAEKEFEDSESKESIGDISLNKSLNNDDLEEMDPADLIHLMSAVGEDDSVILDRLTPYKIEQLQEFRANQQASRVAAIQSLYQSKLNALKDSPPVPLLKVRLIDANDAFSTNTPLNVFLSIWRPDEQLGKDLVEGSLIQLKSIVPTVNSLELRLNTTRVSEIHPLVLSPQAKSQFLKFQRSYSSLPEILSPSFSPLFGEFDTVGIIVHIMDLGDNSGITVYIGDANQKIVGLRFWTSLVNQGIESEVQVGKFVVLHNLQWRVASPRCSIPTAFFQETSLITLDTSAPQLRKALDFLSEQVKDVKRFLDCCGKKVNSLLNGIPEEDLLPRRRLIRSPSPPWI